MSPLFCTNFTGFQNTDIQKFKIKRNKLITQCEIANKRQFEGIRSLVLHFLYGPSLTTTRDHWENP